MINGLENKLCNISNYMEFVKLSEDYGVMFRFENTEDDRVNGKTVKMYRCIAVCRIDNEKFGNENLGDFTLFAKYFNLDKDIDLSEIYEIKLYERHDNDSLGMLLLQYGKKINEVIKKDMDKWC